MKKKAIVVLTVLTIVAAAVCFAACGEGVKVTLDLAGGVYGGSDENIVATVKGGQIDLGEYRPEYEGAQISGWTDEEGNFYGANAIVAVEKELKLTAVYEGVLQYTRVEGGYSVFAGAGFKGVRVAVPAAVDGVPVVEVAENAFKGCESIETLVIPDSVKKIGRGAFEGCTSLQNLILPFAGASATVTSEPNMGMAYLFGSSSSSWTRYPELKTITVSSAATYVPNGAFEGMRSLERVYLGENITGIGERAFQNCTGLLQVRLPEKCVTIANRAFYNCSKASIEIEGAITSLGASAFYNSGLSEITLAGGESMKSIGTDCFNSSRITAIELPATIEQIGSSAFRNCKSLTRVTFNSQVTLYSSAFADCVKLDNSSLVLNAGAKIAFAEGAEESAFSGTKVDITQINA